VQLEMRVAVFAYMGFHQYSATLIIPNYDNVVMLLRHCCGVVEAHGVRSVVYVTAEDGTTILRCNRSHALCCTRRVTNTLVCGVTLLERLTTPSLVELTLLARSTLTLIALLTFSTIVYIIDNDGGRADHPERHAPEYPKDRGRRRTG
jgi:hypothetical protein